jgi:hypothetical protein
MAGGENKDWGGKALSAGLDQGNSWTVALVAFVAYLCFPFAFHELSSVFLLTSFSIL